MTGADRALALLLVTSLTLVAGPILRGAADRPQSTETGLGLPDPSRTFDAASVRQNTSGDRGYSGRSDQGNVTSRNMPLKALILQAFSIQDPQLIGGPGWLATDRFDIVAKTDTKASTADMKPMMQNLLIERFAIKVHVETRNLPVYALLLARSDGRLGPDLKEAACDTYTTGQGCGSAPGPTASVSGGQRGAGGGGGVMSVGAGGGAGPPLRGASMSSSGMTMPSFARQLSGIMGRMVIDRTGLTARFDMKLRYLPPGSAGGADDPAQNAPELFTALQEQLGLKLEATRGPVEVLVIDSVDHPKNDDFVMPDMNAPSAR